ncbi:hypothetical protein SYNPS1DRAFT_4980, partial [Syncephalis pseudoplumigaleata]
MGHRFRSRKFDTPTACQLCHDPLWGSKQSALECWDCKLVSHKSCLPLVVTSCADQQKLALTRPVYFMATDAYDCRRWILGLEYFRKDI